MTRRNALFKDAAAQDGSTRARRQVEMQLDITPMIDVTFLLLIFFMVASTMQATTENDIPTARHGIGVETGRSTIISIRAPDTDSPPTIRLGEGGASADLNDVRDYVQAGVDQNRSQVIIKADREVRHGFVQEVARAVNSVDGVTFFIGVRDKQTN